MTLELPWRSPDGESNAIAMRVQYQAGFRAIAEYDRIGHLLLHRAGSGAPASTIEAVVGIAMLRRAVTLFTGIRTLLENSLPDVAKAPARAYFELWLQHQCLAYGSTQPVALETSTTSADREPRARRYHVAAERWALKARATILIDGEKDAPQDELERLVALEREASNEIGRLRREFPVEWQFFGEVTDARMLTRRPDPEWFSAEFSTPVKNLRQLARAFGHVKEYDLLYDAFSALMHSRGTGHDLTLGNDSAEIHHPHDPTWFQTIAWFSAGWHQLLLMTAAKWHYREMISQLQDLFSREKEAIASMAPETFPNLLA